MGNDVEKQLQEKIAEMESEVDKRIEEEKTEEQDKVWPGDLFGATRKTVEGEDDRFLVEVPGAGIERFVSDVREWRDEAMADPPDDNSVQIAGIKLEMESLEEEDARIVGRLAELGSALSKLRIRGSEPSWIAPVRAILKPHEAELNKAVGILYSQVTEVGLNRSGRIIRSSSPIDGEVPDQTGLEMDSPPTRKEVQDMFVAVERLKRWLESPASE